MGGQKKKGSDVLTSSEEERKIRHVSYPDRFKFTVYKACAEEKAS